MVRRRFGFIGAGTRHRRPSWRFPRPTVERFPVAAKCHRFCALGSFNGLVIGKNLAYLPRIQYADLREYSFEAGLVAVSLAAADEHFINSITIEALKMVRVDTLIGPTHRCGSGTGPGRWTGRSVGLAASPGDCP